MTTTISLFGESGAGVSTYLERLATGHYGKDEERKSLTMSFNKKTVIFLDGYNKEADVYFFMYDIRQPSQYQSFVKSLRFQEIKDSNKKLYILATKYDLEIRREKYKIDDQLAKQFYVVSSKTLFQIDKPILSAIQ